MPNHFFESGNGDVKVDVQQIAEFEKYIQEVEAKIQIRIEAMKKNFESLWNMKNQHNDLMRQYAKNPTSKMEKEIQQLEVDIQSKQSVIEEVKPQESIEKLETFIATKKLELRRLIAHVTLDNINAKASPSLAPNI